SAWLLVRTRPVVRALGSIGWSLLPRFGELDHQTLIFGSNRRAAECLAESRCRALADLEIALIGGEADSADVCAVDVAVAADQRQQPARVGVVPPAGVQLEPGGAFEALAGAALDAFFAALRGGDDILGRGQICSQSFDQRSRNGFWRQLLHDVVDQRLIFVFQL